MDHSASRALDTTSIYAIDRPHPNLLKQYIAQALLTGPLSPLVCLLLYFRYHSMRYRFDEHGVTKTYGILQRREVHLTYARIQDIHLSSGPIQRWLGLADLQVQTASGSAGAELVVEGLLEFEAVRDFLYSKMRGIQAPSSAPATAPTNTPASVALSATSSSEVVSLLHEIRDDLRASRDALAEQSGGR
ncbi:MAG: PH domain-containing protein [Polyangiaceae bacterium]